MVLKKETFPGRILMTADCIGGVWTYALDLCRKLTSKGFEVVLAVMGSHLSDTQKTAAEKIPNLFLFESAYKLEWMDDPWEDINEAGKWLKKIAEEFEPDIIHLNSYSFGAVEWNAPVIIVAHSDVFSWWNDVKNESPPEYWNNYYHHVECGLLNADLIIAPSFYMLSSLQRNFGLLKKKRVIYNGRDRDLFRRNEKKNYIFASGRIWDEAKNLISLVNASHRLGYPVYLAGENNHPVNGKRIDFSEINFLGKLSQQEISEYLSHASIFVHPAKYEPFGLAPLEAAYSGAALVLGDIPSLKEIWQDNALYFEPENRDALIETVNKLISNPLMLQEFARKAFHHSFNFSAEKMCNEYISVYSSFFQTKSRRKVYV